MITLNDGLDFARNDLVKFLEQNNIQTRNLFAGNILRHPLFITLEEGKDFKKIGELPNTDKIMNNSFWIGVYPAMDKKEIDFMIEIIRKFVD